ncbi:HNH endonuclease [Arthrobacter sp. ISL-72]|uniref:HNH endonuclease n=1 Tax=Arthrobacter sp. ISL-72 TaxID=2819114 RepID=UPI002889C06D|nr:HNH endonuclease [Arthrobacter sp. ISL-72]
MEASKGGSTSLQNFVAACSRCNRSKGAHIPSPARQERLERRRRRYVPSGCGDRRRAPAAPLTAPWRARRPCRTGPLE